MELLTNAAFGAVALVIVAWSAGLVIADFIRIKRQTEQMRKVERLYVEGLRRYGSEQKLNLWEDNRG